MRKNNLKSEFHCEETKPTHLRVVTSPEALSKTKGPRAVISLVTVLVFVGITYYYWNSTNISNSPAVDNEVRPETSTAEIKQESNKEARMVTTALNNDDGLLAGDLCLSNGDCMSGRCRTTGDYSVTGVAYKVCKSWLLEKIADGSR